MAAIERKTKRYPTDLSDEEWARIEPVLPRSAKRGRPREVDLREILNAIRYLVRTGCGWRMLPNDFPPSGTVYWWFRRFVRCCDLDEVGDGSRQSIELAHNQEVAFADEVECCCEFLTVTERRHLLPANPLAASSFQLAHLRLAPRLLLEGRRSGIADFHVLSACRRISYVAAGLSHTAKPNCY
jgi:transposase